MGNHAGGHEASYTGATSPSALFSEDLRQVYDASPKPLPSFSADLNHRGRTPTDAEGYKSISGVYLDDSALESLEQPYVPRVEFEPKPFRGLGREDSRRKVFFGDLHLIGNERSVGIPVAVKPFAPPAFDQAIHEMGMFQYMHEIGMPTLQVLGIVAVAAGETPRSYVLTHEKPGITTLDNVDWKTLDTEERWTRMRPAIETLALMHSHMLFHGDLEFKNVAYGEEDRSICIVDPEEAASLRDRVTPYEDWPEERALVVKKVSADLEAVRKSVRGFILEYQGTEPEQFEELLEHVFAPYYLTILRMDSPYQDVLRSAFSDVLDQKQRQAYGLW